MTDKNIEYLKKDYFESNYFQSNFNSDSKLIEIKQANELTNIFLKQLENIFKISCPVEEISNLHNKLDENLKVYDQKFRINQISNHFYDMPDAFKNKYIELLKLQLRELIGQDFYFQDNPTLRVQTPHISAKSLYPFYHSDIQKLQQARLEDLLRWMASSSLSDEVPDDVERLPESKSSICERCPYHLGDIRLCGPEGEQLGVIQ